MVRYDDLISNFPQSLETWLRKVASKHKGLVVKTKSFGVSYKNDKSHKAAFEVSAHSRGQFYRGRGKECPAERARGHWSAKNLNFAKAELDWEEEAKWGFSPVSLPYGGGGKECGVGGGSGSHPPH